MAGNIGRVPRLQRFQAGSISWGWARATRWPIAQVTMVSAPVKQPSPRLLAPRAAAMSRATEGFSAMTAVVTGSGGGGP